MNSCMSKKKLVVSGCSWTAGTISRDKNGKPFFLTDDTKNVNSEFTLWPEYLGEMLNMDEINVGFGSIGNEFIYNNIVDELSSTKDVGLAVTCWSGHVRWDFNSFGKYGDRWRTSETLPTQRLAGRNQIKTLTIDPSVSDERLSKLYLTNKLKPLVD